MKPVIAAVAAASAAVVCVALVGSPASAARSTDDGYLTSVLPVEGATPGVSGGSFDERAGDAVVTSWTLEAAGRGYVITLAGGERFECAAGKLFGNTNPFVGCTTASGDSVTLDYPPYGNATKKTMSQACATFTDNGRTTVTTVPPGCLAQVHVTVGGVTRPITTQSLPFTMTQSKP